MRKSTSLGAKALALALLTGSSSALAAGQGDDPFGSDAKSRWRLGFNSGFTIPKDVDPAPGGPIELENGFLFSGTLGYHLGNLNERVGLAVELEGLFTEADIDDDNLAGFGSASGENVSSAAAMVNGVLDWRWSEAVSLSLGAGVGYAVNDFDTFKDLGNSFKLDDGQEDAIAAQAKVGLVYDLGGGFSWTLGYRFFKTESLEAEDSALGQTFDLTTEIHSLELGVRYSL